MQTKKTKLIYSVFSGTLYETPEDDVSLLDIGHLPLIHNPKHNCKKCFNKRHLGRDINNFTYTICSCIKNIIDLDLIKKNIPISNI